MAEINKWLDEFESERETRFKPERKGMLRQYDGFRTEWNGYVNEWLEMDNLYNS